MSFGYFFRERSGHKCRIRSLCSPEPEFGYKSVAPAVTSAHVGPTALATSGLYVCLGPEVDRDQPSARYPEVRRGSCRQGGHMRKMGTNRLLPRLLMVFWVRT